MCEFELRPFDEALNPAKPWDRMTLTLEEAAKTVMVRVKERQQPAYVAIRQRFERF